MHSEANGCDGCIFTKDSNGDEYGCTRLTEWINSPAGAAEGWAEVSAAKAQEYANAGYPTIGINPGHVAVIAPSPNPGDGKIYVSQSGLTDYITRLKPIEFVWDKDEEKQFFYHE